LHRIESGGADGGDQAGDEAHGGQDGARYDQSRHGHGQVDIALPGSVLEKWPQQRQGTNQFHQRCGENKAQQATRQRQHQSFKQDLHEDVPPPCADSFQDTDLARPFCDGHQHDVDHAHGPDAERKGPDNGQQDLQAETQVGDDGQELIPLDDLYRPQVLHVKAVSAGEGGPEVGGDPIPELIADGPQYDVIQVTRIGQAGER
jgi:hypothetical protein